MKSVPLTSKYAGQHIPVLNVSQVGQILPVFQRLVKVLRNAPLPTNTGQHNPITAATNSARRLIRLMGVDHRRADFPVTQELLNGPDVMLE